MAGTIAGTYRLREVADLTMYSGHLFVAAEHDDVEGIQALARDLDEEARGERSAPASDEFLRRRLLSDTDNDDATETSKRNAKKTRVQRTGPGFAPRTTEQCTGKRHIWWNAS
jgi:hypothetical protein